MQTAYAVPDRTRAQRLAALDRANEIRALRADLKRDLARGRVRIAELLADPPDWLMTAKISDIALAVPKYGRVKVNKILVRCGISPTKTIGGLTKRQRDELIASLRR